MLKLLDDTIGKKFGRLTVLADAGCKNWRRQLLCKCDCGTIKELRENSLKTGNTLSCGCAPKERQLRKQAKENGLTIYYTGIPCKNGHLCARMTSTGMCVECAKMWDMARFTDPKRTKWKKEYSASYQRRRRETRPDIREKDLLRSREYKAREDIKERDRERMRRLRLNPVFRLMEKNNKDPIQVSVSNNKRRTRVRNAYGFHSKNDIKEIKILQKSKCAYCRVRLKYGFHVDHIQPLSRGGSNYRSNLQILCGPCNSRKHAKDPISFARELGMLL